MICPNDDAYAPRYVHRFRGWTVTEKYVIASSTTYNTRLLIKLAAMKPVPVRGITSEGVSIKMSLTFIARYSIALSNRHVSPRYYKVTNRQRSRFLII